MEIRDDLISRVAAIEAAIDGADDWDGGYNPERERYIREHMANVPAVDAAPVVHARWSEKRWTTDYGCGVIKHRAIVCSACKGEIADGEYTHYCPNCGAKMDGRADDEDAAV